MVHGSIRACQKLNGTVHLHFRDCLSLARKFQTLVALPKTYTRVRSKGNFKNRQIICVLNEGVVIERKNTCILCLVTYYLGKVPYSTTSLLNYQQ